ncbi:hypothetical protein [Rhodobacteraceae bacterium DSL-40]|uniref:hypothetical protein n=1 Tax=Amaricoccus sp. B4 TaxID=3368557 RepID=UPI000DAC6B22
MLFTAIMLMDCVWSTKMTHAQSTPDEVRVGIFVTSISAIEPRDGSFRIAGYLWFVDPSGTFDTERDFEFLARTATHETFARKILPGGEIYTAISFDAVVDHAFNVRNYPFDAQTLTLHVESARSTATRIFVPDRESSQIAQFVRAPGWRVESLLLDDSLETYDTDFGYRTEKPVFSRLEIGIGIQRNLSPFLLEKFTGFFVALAITALVLIVPVQELGTRVGMTTGSVFAAVFNRYRMEDAIGFDAVFGIADQISLLTFSAILQILVLSLVTHNLCQRRRLEVAQRVDHRAGAAIIILHMILIAIAFAAAMT